MTQTMRAMVIDRYGNPDVLREAEIPRPTPRRGQVLVRTRCIGVNPKDIVVRKGKFAALTGKKFPLVIGHDIAGEVVQSRGRTGMREGDLVYGMINDLAGRAYAEYAAVDAEQLAHVPSGLALEEAAAVPLAAQTALQALRGARAQAGRTVVINGASGGVGTFAIQIAKVLGAEVTAICSHRNVDLCRELGADAVVDYTRQNVLQLSDQYDVFFDVFGNYHFDDVRHLLKTKAHYVHTLPDKQVFADFLRTFGRSQRATLVLVRSRRRQLDFLSRCIESGTLRPVVDRTFPFGEVAEAHRYIETKRARGKVVLRVE